jgi:hypothetical protein
VLRGVSKDRLLAYWDRYFAPGAPMRRKLSVHVVSRKHEADALKPGTVGPGVKLIESMDEMRRVKRTLPLYPALGRE